jgi:type IV pilus assembly protein PilY1
MSTNITSRMQRLFTAVRQCAQWAIAALLVAHTLPATAVNFTPLPPFLTETKGAPMVMLNISKDHQLFYKAYNEFTDLDGDGLPDTQYRHTFRYYGYFDNKRCYVYSTTNNRFAPTRKENASTATDPTYCGGTDEWHGNFLNWATMTRMDVVRRILYGGFRSTDNSIVSGTSLTVLERAHLPTDAHSFAKYYSGTDVRKLTPFSPAGNELTICNTSFKNGTNQYSHNAISAPSMLVASGNHALWNSNERWQCYWSEVKSASNGNVFATSGINASNSNPSRATSGLGTGYEKGSYYVQVEVCKTGLDSAPTGSTGFTDDEENKCKYYPLGNYKPAGLLQKYGERNEAAFGLMTGSFQKNISGGILRKNVSTFTDEIDLDDGQFKNVAGIVKTMNSIRMYGYNYDSGDYTNASVDNCQYQEVSVANDRCANWGNPMGEMYLEALKYLAGKTDPALTDAKGATLGLSVATWTDPFAEATKANFGEQLCRRTSIVNFNASVTSYDNDEWSSQSVLPGLSGATTVESLTDAVGNAEGLYATNKKWSVGSTTSASDRLCSDKSMTNLSTAIGICPEAPTYDGGFKIAGAALYAHTNPIRTDFTIPSNNKSAFRVDTYGIALSTSTPRITISIPGQAGKVVVLMPALRFDKGTAGQAGGSLVDFRVISQTATAGRYLVQWEISAAGGDYDQDVWGTLEYSVTGTNLTISTKIIDKSTSGKAGFGYVISGTNGKDGVHFHSGANSFTYTDPTTVTVSPATNINASGGCQACVHTDLESSVTYTMTGVSGESLKEPLWYAAKYGGFDSSVAPTYTGTSAAAGTALPTTAWDSKKTDGSAGSDGIPDTFFFAIDPNQLEKSLEQIFSTILKSGGAAPAAATSGRTLAGGYVYLSTQSIKAAASGNDSDNSGEFLRFSYLSDGTVSTNADWDAGAKLTTQLLSDGWNTGRRVFTLNDTTGTAAAGPTTFRWASLTTAQQDALRQSLITVSPLDTATIGQNRLNWLRGDDTNETTAGGLRKRTKTKLGALINSTPWYIGPASAKYTDFDYGGGYSAFITAKAARNSVAVGGNDGMLHVFDGATGVEQFAYVPRAMYSTSTTAPYSKLAALTGKDFLLSTNANRLNVDGSVMAADINMSTTTTPDWKTYLFGAFGRGATGVYALDVTSPEAITAENAANAAAVVKWEFTSAADADMGYITGRTNVRNNKQPWQTGYMANGKWAAIYGNGYNSANGHAALFIIFANGPTTHDPATGWTAGTYIKLATGPLGQGPNNGLATPTAVDTNNDGKIDTIYAGDLKGNVWKFDVSSADTANWKVSTQASASDTTKVPVFTATTTLPSTTTVVNQPITTAVVPFVHPLGGYQLFFGTGKVLESTDYPMSQLYSHTLYGIYDKPGTVGTITTGKTDLVQQTTQTGADGVTRYASTNAVSYPTKKGWYLDLPVSSEGVIFNPASEDSARVRLSSSAPQATSDGCRYDTRTFDWSLSPITGIPVQFAVGNVPAISGFRASGSESKNTFDSSSGGVFKTTDPSVVASGNLGSTAPNSTGTCVAGSSANCVCNPGIATQCETCADPLNCTKSWDPTPTKQCLYRNNAANANGTVTTTVRYGTCSDGRLTWREILRNR